MKTRAESGGHAGESHFLLHLIQHFDKINKSEDVTLGCIIQMVLINLPALV